MSHTITNELNTILVVAFYIILFGTACSVGGYLFAKIQKDKKWIEIKKKHAVGVFNPKKDETNIMEGNTESFFE